MMMAETIMNIEENKIAIPSLSTDTIPDPPYSGAMNVSSKDSGIHHEIYFFQVLKHSTGRNKKKTEATSSAENIQNSGVPTEFATESK